MLVKGATGDEAPVYYVVHYDTAIVTRARESDI